MQQRLQRRLYNTDVDLAGEVDRLRALLDKVPSCLMRVAHDGTLLAASDAALSLLGARELADVLDKNLVERLDGRSIQTLWGEFADRVAQSGLASMECQMIEPGGEPRTVLLLGAALPAHPDAVPSMFIAVRDVSGAKRLEASLHEQTVLRASAQEGLQQANARVEDLRAQLATAQQQRVELEERLVSGDAHRQRLAAAVEELSKALGSAVTATAALRKAVGSEKGS